MPTLITSEKRRITFLDIAKGLGMISVILGHNLTRESELIIRIIIYTFHMPFFYFISGYFISEKHTISTLVKSRSKSLLLPYIITVLIGVALTLPVNPSYSYKILLSGFYGSPINIPEWNIFFIGYIWFLPSLFFSIFIASFFTRRRILPALLTLSLFSTLAYSASNYLELKKVPFFILPGLYSAIYVYLGFIFKKADIFNRKYTIFLLPLAILIYLIFVDTQNTQTIYNLNINNPLYASLSSIAGIYILISLSKLIDLYKPLRRMLIIIGSYSLFILCVHQIFTVYIPWRTIQFYSGIDLVTNPYIRIIRDLVCGCIIAWAYTKFLLIYRLNTCSRK